MWAIETNILGLGIAYLLYLHHNIKIYEEYNYIGDRILTIDVNTKNGNQI